MFRKDGLQVATIAPNSHIVMKKIVIGQDLGADVQVASGLDAGDRVVDNPPDSLAQGDLVRVSGAQARLTPVRLQPTKETALARAEVKPKTGVRVGLQSA